MKIIIKSLIFIICLLIFDFILSQSFLFDLLDYDQNKAYQNDLNNRVPNKDYKYTFKENVSFLSIYNNGLEKLYFNIATNDLGFRDSSVKNINRDKKYSIVIGDSFVEGSGLKYDETLVGLLNKNLKEQFNNFEFLNAGVASYSTHIYKRKIKTVLSNNNWLNVNSVVLLYDKSDIHDDLQYLNYPNKLNDPFPIGNFSTHHRHTIKNLRKEKLLSAIKNFNIGSIITEHTIIGFFFRETISTYFEQKFKNIEARFKISKEFNSSFFKIDSNKINSFHTKNKFKWMKDHFYEPNWSTHGIRSINFAIDNFNEIKQFLEKRNIALYIVVYPWPFELLDKTVSDRYLTYLLSKLEEEKINSIIIYDQFHKGNVDANIAKFYILKDVHFKKDGNLVLRDHVYKRLLKDKLIPN